MNAMSETLPTLSLSDTQPLSTDAVDLLPLAYLELNAVGTIIYANRAACLLFRLEREQILGKSAWEFMATEEVEMSRAVYLEALQSKEELKPIRRTLYNANGEFHVYDMFRNQILDAQGNVLGMRYQFVDVTKMKYEHEELNRVRQWLESVLASVNEAVLVMDTLGFIRYVNPALEKLSGWSASELLGQVVEKKLPVLSYTANDNTPTPFTHRAQLDNPTRGRATVLNKKRETMLVEISSSPILDKERGYTLGIVSILHRLRESSSRKADQKKVEQKHEVKEPAPETKA